MDAQTELERAYRALQAFYRYAVRKEQPSEAVMAYHIPTIAAALRFVDEGKLDGSEYFIGKSVDVLHDVLRRALPPSTPGECR